MMKSQLLCTFTHLEGLTTSVAYIRRTYEEQDIRNLKCYYYVYEPTSVICVYNVEPSDKKIQNTISINKNKDTNTFYSINALNSLIRILNNGVLDKTFRINWPQYQNTLLLSDGSYNCKVIEIKEL